MSIVAIDWAAHGGIAWGDAAGQKGSARSLNNLLTLRRNPTAYVCNPFFYNFDSRELKTLMAAFAAAGHALIYARWKGLEVLAAASGEELDDEDFTMVAPIVAGGANAVHHGLVADFEWRSVRSALDVGHHAALVGAVPSMAEDAIEVLGPLDTLEPDMRRALGVDGQYGLELLDALARAAKAAPSTGLFERYLTLTKAPTIGQLTGTVRSHYRTISSTDSSSDPISLSAYRRGLRHTYARLHAARTSRAAA